jgi:hypothetical protein
MRKFFAVAMGSLVALAGFAGVANASATVDLIWVDFSDSDCTKAARRDCPRIGSVNSSPLVSDNLTAIVLITAGPGGILGAGVSVDYSDSLPKFSVVNFRRFNTKPFLPSSLGVLSNKPPLIDNINAASQPFLSNGVGLPAGNTAYLGTVTFHKDAVISGTSEFQVGTFGATDAVLRLTDNANISSTTTFNSAFAVNVPEPGALSLLVMGLGGMLLAGRGRRS